MAEVILDPTRNYVVLDANSFIILDAKDFKNAALTTAWVAATVASFAWAWYATREDRNWRKTMKKERKMREEAQKIREREEDQPQS